MDFMHKKEGYFMGLLVIGRLYKINNFFPLGNRQTVGKKTEDHTKGEVRLLSGLRLRLRRERWAVSGVSSRPLGVAGQARGQRALPLGSDTAAVGVRLQWSPACCVSGPPRGGLQRGGGARPGLGAEADGGVGTLSPGRHFPSL